MDGARGILALTLLLSVTPTHGSGFALIERDAAGLGRAYAGQAAVIAPSAVAFNPAALPTSTTVSANVMHLWNHLQPEDAGTEATVPAFFGTSHGFGLGMYGEFGLATDYPSDWTGRYHALHSEITAARIQIAGAYPVTPTVRLGAGLFLQSFEAELTQAVPTPLGDRVSKVDGNDSGIGWTLGVLWTPAPELALGLSYGSSVDHVLSGTATTPRGRQGASVPITTPEVVRSGVRWTVRPQLALMAGATWTRWSRLQALDIRLADDGRLIEEHGWRDTWRLDLGGEYALGPWTWRLGTAWDQSPVATATHRSPRLPDSDRTWLAGGFDYRIGPWILSLSYAHLWFAGGWGEHPPIDYSAGSDILAAGITWTW
jgi:long-chain fatty acid transport protein